MLLALLLLIFLLCLYRVKFNLHGFNEDYLSKDSTNSIKGIFILLIVISHSIQYIRDCNYSFSQIGDSCFVDFYGILFQWVVVMFLFYSGYGVGESFKKKRMAYVKAMPRHRILGTLLNFDVAVIVFIILDLLLGISISTNQCLLALTGWKAVGNDNWYIFVILLCYLMTYITLRLSISKPSYRVAFLFILSALCIIVISFFKGCCWYNTILCYPLGFMYSTYKDTIEVTLKRTYWKYAIVLVVLFVSFYVIFHDCPNDQFQIAYNVKSILFGLLIVIVTLKVSIKNQPLRWCGTHLFPIFIYMRLPMIFMETKVPTLVGNYPALFILISLAVTLVIAHFYKYWEIKL